jgi:hypothetical protein
MGAVADHEHLPQRAAHQLGRGGRAGRERRVCVRLRAHRRNAVVLGAEESVRVA